MNFKLLMYMIKIKALLQFIPMLFSNFTEIKKLIFNFVLFKQSEKNCRKYTLPKVISISDLVSDFDEKISKYTFLSDTSLDIDIALIKAMARQIPNCDYLEIGSFRGESIMNLVPEVQSATSISLDKEELRMIGALNDQIEAEGCQIQSAPNYTRIQHNSHTFDFSSLGKKFDLIFIDGDHSEEGVIIDTHNAFKFLKNENSIIIWHDFGSLASFMRYDVIAGVYRATTAEQQKYIYRVKNTLCGIFIQKNLQELQTVNPYLPDDLYDVTIKMHA